VNDEPTGARARRIAILNLGAAHPTALPHGEERREATRLEPWRRAQTAAHRPPQVGPARLAHQ